ncbi:MAG: sugar phosphate nucleotidyltransferase [Lachnospiraceae bacterium]|nr:cupin domain-containing protein [Lachnospiraceae bacterium]MDD7049395.1 sugar phosphate nucleotidyltransferase [Lachnospiraceae bacterium]
MYYVLLSGGSGKRLWPLSNEVRPKQYLKLVNPESNSMERCSMVQRVWKQMQEADLEKHTIITAGCSQEELIRSQIKDAKIALEPEARDTFPAVLLSCAYLHSILGAHKEEYAVILPVDAYTQESFFVLLPHLKEAVRSFNAQIGLIGAKPHYAASKYGYMVPLEQKQKVKLISRFVEKPDEAEAERLIRQGALWNCGVFCVQIGDILSMASEFHLTESYEDIRKNYHRLPAISFDYQVLEKADKLIALEYNGYWKDLGTWSAMAEQMSTNTQGNVLMDEHCLNTQVINELDCPIVVAGGKNLVVAASQDGILVADKNHTEGIKQLVQDFHSNPRFEERRWGTLQTLDDSNEGEHRVLTRKIKIHEGMNSSYHHHENRDELWTVLRGQADLILEGNRIRLLPGKVICIRRGQRHAVKALEEFEYIETHVGSSGGNEDIHRITFKWDEISLSQIL